MRKEFLSGLSLNSLYKNTTGFALISVEEAYIDNIYITLFSLTYSIFS